VRVLDEGFTLDTIRTIEVGLTVDGDDTFRLTGKSSMREIARDPAALVGEMFAKVHQYPDGAVLYLGTMFAPTEDRGAKGAGFTHKVGDIVTIHAPELGALTNRMTTSDKAPAWTFGTAALMRNLAKRGLL
jgi:fumarylacetoacetate (FAA) hydrolase family protein